MPQCITGETTCPLQPRPTVLYPAFNARLRGCALDRVDAEHPRDHLVELGVVEDLRPSSRTMLSRP
jgi:hypothetical protein